MSTCMLSGIAYKGERAIENKVGVHISGLLHWGGGLLLFQSVRWASAVAIGRKTEPLVWEFFTLCSLLDACSDASCPYYMLYIYVLSTCCLLQIAIGATKNESPKWTL
jgi:hypothetical protein